jgi:hypothetical protein
VNPAAANLLQQPFVQVALPIIVALMLAAWLQNKRFDDVNRRIDEFRTDVNLRPDRIETKLESPRANRPFQLRASSTHPRR